MVHSLQFKLFVVSVGLWLMAESSTGTHDTGDVLFSCNFFRDVCGMYDQPGSRAQWKREYVTLGRRNGYAMVVRANEANNHFARFQTGFLPTREKLEGCLRFRYYISGQKPSSLSVIKQGFITEYVFGTARKTLDRWETAQVDVKFHGDSVMFYFEADTRIQDYGDSIVAFTDVSITTNSCQRKRPTG